MFEKPGIVQLRQAAQQLVTPVVMDDGLAHHRAEAGHAIGEPSRHLPAMQRQIGASSPAGHKGRCQGNGSQRNKTHGLVPFPCGSGART